jgi:deoxyribonuclease-2
LRQAVRWSTISAYPEIIEQCSVPPVRWQRTALVKRSRNVILSALDENGKAVDWWFAYKVPQLGGSGSAPAKGYEYIYYDPNLGKVVTSPYLLTVDKGALDLTLDAVFRNPSDTTGWILYNDEFPDGANDPVIADNGSLGHTKGLIAFDTETKTALWLLHSWPKFVLPGAPALPTPKYGQTYLCVSLDLATASAIAAVMIDHQEPQVFKSSRVPASLPASDPLRRLTQSVDPNAKGDSHILDFQSRGGKAFKLIAKNRKWGGDFWNQLVGPALGVTMDVETWIRGAIPSELDSDAPGAINLNGKEKVFDVKSIDLTPLGAPWKWPETKDHAKWGIGVEGDWVCVGDINRMISQEKRGGGAVAFQESGLWAALAKTDSLNPEGPEATGTKPPPLPATTTRSVAIGGKHKAAPGARAKPATKARAAAKSATRRVATAKNAVRKKAASAKAAIPKKAAAAKAAVRKKTAIAKAAVRKKAASAKAAMPKKAAAAKAAVRSKAAAAKLTIRKKAAAAKIAVRRKAAAVRTRRASSGKASR